MKTLQSKNKVVKALIDNYIFVRDYAVQTVVEACSVKLQQYLFTDEDKLGK